MSSSSSSSAAGSPEDRIERVSSLCSLGHRPRLVTGWLRQMLIAHFAEASQIEDESLREYLWSPELANQKIVIESVRRWNPQMTAARPAVLIRRHAWTNERRGINNQQMGMFARDGYERYSSFMSGSHTLFCMAPEGGEVEALGWEVYRFLIAFSAIIRQDLDLIRFHVAEVGEAGVVEESDQHEAVPVTVAYAHEEMHTIKPDAPRLKRIVLKEFLR